MSLGKEFLANLIKVNDRMVNNRMSKSKKSIEREIGDIGEEIVYNYMISKLDPKVYKVLWKGVVGEYDNVRDIILEHVKNGSRKNVEVKTQVPFIKEKAFTFRQSQLKKCMEANLLFFVSIGVYDKAMKSTPAFFDKVFLCDKPKELKISKTKTRDGRTMVTVPIDQPGIVCVKHLTKEESKKLQDEYFKIRIK